jgi:peptide/nickel transport system substrate-binding protein
MTLRQGVTFHTGRTFGAEEAAWNIVYAQNPKNAVTGSSGFQGIQVAAPAASTLVLKLPQVTPQIFSLLGGLLMLDPQSDVSKGPGGTGPFKLESLDPGNELRLVRHSAYWRPGRPYLDAVMIKTLPDPARLVVNLESGAIHAGAVPANEAQRLSATGNTRIDILPSGGMYEFVLKTVDTPLSDRRVRQALSLAIDRQRFADNVLDGLMSPQYSIWPKNSPVYDASLDTGTFDLERAARLLTEAGYANGFETTVVTGGASFPALLKFQQIYQTDLARIGVKLSIQDMESNQFVSAISQGKFPALAAHANAGPFNQDPALPFSNPIFRIDENVTGFNSREYASLVQNAQLESDAARRLNMYRQIAQLVKDEAFVLPITNFSNPFGMRTNVESFDTLAPTQIVYDEIRLS